MIKFFRHIRRSLINQNNMGKYFKYAIGEILLVVIGILIALSINNWNQNRNDAKKEISYLNNLLTELDSNKDWSEFYIEFSKKQYVAANYLSDVINSKVDSIDVETFVDAIFRCHYLPHPNFGKNVWEELKSTGDLSIIKNKKLTQSLSSYFNYLDYPVNLEKEWGLTHIKYRDLANEIIDFEIVKKIAEKRVKSNKIDNSLIESKFAIDRQQLKQMVEEFKAVEDIPGLLVDIYINRTVAEMTYKHILDETNRVQAIIEKEIELIR